MFKNIRSLGVLLDAFGVLEHVLEVAISLAETNEERSAALQELSLLHQQIGGRKTDTSRKSLSKARNELGDQPDPWLQLNTDFGLLSQTIITLKNRPWLFFTVSGLFRQYEQDIELFRKKTSDKESAALHESLYHLYRGRYRFKVFGWLANIITPLADWIIAPFDVARSTIGDAKDIHLHSQIDVLAYRSIARAYLRRCKNPKVEMSEIERLVKVLNDDARSKHWENQKREIAKHCGGI